MSSQLITVEVTVNAPVQKVWDAWTKPEYITKWNFASDDWQCPWAKVDLKEGGIYSARMEAKDGSVGFEFEATYTKVEQFKRLDSVMSDGRTISVSFEDLNGKTRIVETFQAESENPIEMQRGGWQAILDNFKNYAEA